MTEALNWFGIIFAIGVPIAVIIGMTMVLISDSRKKKRRRKRCHRTIKTYLDINKEDK